MTDGERLPRAASFTDDTTLPHARFTVSIHAQVLKDQVYSWFFALRASVQGRREFKKEAIDVFFSLAETERAKLLRSLGKVRIHIGDPRPYVAEISEALEKHLPKGISAEQFLRRMPESCQGLELPARLTVEHIASRMLDDSPGERLKRKHRAWEQLMNGIHIDQTNRSSAEMLVESDPPNEEHDLSPFRHRSASILRDVARFSSASASVFSPAHDRFDEALDDPFFSAPLAATYLINNALSSAHAFDEGNEKEREWIAERRRDVLMKTDRDQRFYPLSEPDPLQQLISADSIPIQVADIAAGIARELWYRNNLVHLIKNFEYVTYNGERLSETKAGWYQEILMP